METDKTFTLAELRRYDGENGPIYIAFQGIVYDLSDCPNWRSGIHRGLHFPAQDLTGEICEAPHKSEVFNHPCIRKVGCLVS
jgi:predicted heme/steroid binding protein